MPRPAWMGPEATPLTPEQEAKDWNERGRFMPLTPTAEVVQSCTCPDYHCHHSDAAINGPGPNALVEGVDFNRFGSDYARLMAAKPGAAVLDELTVTHAAEYAPSPCPACYTGEYGAEHSFTSACKESE